MIATLNGVVSEKLLNTVVLEVQGIGYDVNITVEDYAVIQKEAPTKLYIYEHIREQAHDLYGFTSRDTKNFFEQLLGVNGIGPKMALNMLSLGSAQEVRAAIAGGDVKFITRASGVGKRVAERVVVELKDKVGLIGVDLASTGMLQSEATVMKDEAAEALMSLGYTAADAAKALQHVSSDLPTETRVKQALKGNS